MPSVPSFTRRREGSSFYYLRGLHLKVNFTQVEACSYQNGASGDQSLFCNGVFIFKLIQDERHLCWSNFPFPHLENAIVVVQKKSPSLNCHECFIYCLINPDCVYLNQCYACYVNNYPRNYHRFRNIYLTRHELKNNHNVGCSGKGFYRTFDLGIIPRKDNYQNPLDDHVNG